MKKLVLLIFTVCMGGGIAASAQEVSQQKLDSLNQALSDISARVKETEAAESNRAIWKDRSKYLDDLGDGANDDGEKNRWVSAMLDFIFT